MKTEQDVHRLHKLTGQLNGLHGELSLLTKKSPNDGLNLFKMRLVNKVLSDANDLLPADYVPFDDFTQFTEDALPTNSDATLILAQYLEQLERFRSNHVSYSSGHWLYVVNGVQTRIEGRPPTKFGGRRE